MSEPAPKRTKLRLKTKKSLFSRKKTVKPKDKIPSDTENLSLPSKSDVIPSDARETTIEREGGDNRLHPRPTDSESGDPLNDLRQSIAHLLPDYLAVDPAHWKHIATIPQVNVTFNSPPTEASAVEEITLAGQRFSWQRLPKSCLHRPPSRRQKTSTSINPMEEYQGAERTNTASNSQSPLCNYENTIPSFDSAAFNAEKVPDTNVDNEEGSSNPDTDGECCIMTGPVSPQPRPQPRPQPTTSRAHPGTQESFPVSPTGGATGPPAVSLCPLCNLNFNHRQSQIDIDAHIAACYAAADDDVTW